jgi:hypothetical protein
VVWWHRWDFTVPVQVRGSRFAARRTSFPVDYMFSEYAVGGEPLLFKFSKEQREK